MNLNPDTDLAIDVSNLSAEFRQFPTTMYQYSLQRAKIDTQAELAKAKLKEVRALAYKRIKGDVTIKHTEKSLEAEIDTDPLVLETQMKLIRAEHDASTWAGVIESLRAKKDCLIQLGADSRKEK